MYMQYVSQYAENRKIFCIKTPFKNDTDELEKDLCAVMS